MRISTLKDLLKRYDAGKGWFRRHFGDQFDIENLRELVLSLSASDSDLNTQQLLLLTQIIFKENTQKGSLSYVTFNEIRRALFDGIVDRSWDWEIRMQQSIGILYKANLLTSKDIKLMSHEPSRFFSTLCNLKASRHNCLTQENWDTCKTAKSPSLVANVIAEFRYFGILSHENRKMAAKFVNYINDLPAIFSYLKKSNLLHTYANVILKNAQYIPEIKQLFRQLWMIQCLDEENVKLALSMPEHAREASHTIQKLRILQVKDVSDQKAQQNILNKYQAKNIDSHRKAIFSIVRDRNRFFYERVEVANLQTPSNVRAILQHADYADYLGRGLKGIATQYDVTERSAQYAFDGLLSCLSELRQTGRVTGPVKLA